MNSPRAFLRWITLLLFFAGTVFLHADDDAHPLYLWSAVHGGAEIVMLGSIHILPEAFYPWPDAIEQAIRRADVLVLEADPSAMDESDAAALLMRTGFYLDGTTLADHLNPKLLDRCVDAVRAAGIPEPQAMMMRPWLLSMSLQAAAIAAAGADASWGMEMVILDRFAGDDIRELEGTEFQLELLGSLSEKEQTLLLESSLDETEEFDELLNGIIDAWKTGNDAAILDLMDSPGAAGALNRRLVTDRNHRMADRILSLTDGAEGVFLVVAGAAHFIGPDGIPGLLEERGYPVTRIQSSHPHSGTAP